MNIYNIIIKLSNPFSERNCSTVRTVRSVHQGCVCPINNAIIIAINMDDTKAIVSTHNEEAVANQPREVGSASR